MLIRAESPQEFSQIHNLVEKAFTTAKVANGTEQDFVLELRTRESYIPELALIAQQDDGELIGHIMLTKTHIIEASHSPAVLLLAPLAVALQYRNQGVGMRLIKQSFKRAKQLNYQAVFLVGDPNYYHRFGFRPVVNFGLRYQLDIPSENVMGYELVPGALAGVNGIVEIF